MTETLLPWFLKTVWQDGTNHGKLERLPLLKKVNDLSYKIKTKKHLIFREKILTFMNFHCNEACILCSMYVWKLFWGNPFHFCLSILLADVYYSSLICLLHSNVNSSQYMSKWMTCIILIIMRYFICFDRSWKDNLIQWYHFTLSIFNS